MLSHKHIERFSSFLAKIRKKMHLYEFLEMCEKEFREILGADNLFVYLCGSTHFPNFYYGLGNDKSQILRLLTEGKGLLPKVIGEKREIVLRNYKELPSHISYVAEEIGPVFGIPLSFDGEVIGGMAISRLPGKESFTQKEIELVKLYVAPISSFVAYKMKEEDLEKERTSKSLIVKTLARVGKESIFYLMEDFLENIKNMLDVDFCLFCTKMDKDRFIPIVCSGISSSAFPAGFSSWELETASYGHINKTSPFSSVLSKGGSISLFTLEANEFGESIFIVGRKDRGFTERDLSTLKMYSSMVELFLKIVGLINKEVKGKIQLEHMSIQLIKSLITVLETRDPYTKGHSERVAKYSQMISEKLGLEYNHIDRIKIASFIHDIGKVGIPDAILFKPTKLTFYEWEIVRYHPLFGYMIAQSVDRLKDIAPWIKHHHERWDGKGYPDGIEGELIPKESRIMAVCDAFDAMTSKRPYRGALSSDEALSVIRNGAGSQWDPEIAKIACEVLRKREAVMIIKPETETESLIDKVRRKTGRYYQYISLFKEFFDSVKDFRNLDTLIENIESVLKKEFYYEFSIRIVPLSKDEKLLRELGFQKYTYQIDLDIARDIVKKLSDSGSIVLEEEPIFPESGLEIVVPLRFRSKIFFILVVALLKGVEKRVLLEGDLEIFISFCEAIGVVLENYLSERELFLERRVDGLTGFYLRDYFEKIFSEKIDSAKELGKSVHLIFIYLPYLKRINMLYGFQGGDRYIGTVSEVLKKVFKDRPIARLSGDSFCTIFEDVEKREVEFEIKRLSFALKDKVKELKIGDELLECLVVYSTFPYDGESLENLMNVCMRKAWG